MKPLKVYISGPITGTTDFIERFAFAENALASFGNIVINPAKVNAGMPEGTTHAEYMQLSFAMLDMCDVIFMLDGWQQSKGANMELERARDKGITIAFEGGTCIDRPKQKNFRRLVDELLHIGIMGSASSVTTDTTVIHPVEQ